MKLANLLRSEHVLLEMDADQHWPAIEELVEHLVVVGSLPVEWKEELLEALKSREEQVSTGIGYGVAIPHTFSERLEKVVVVFGRSTKGIDFSSVDGEPVHLVILFIVPKKDYHLHLQTLAAIAKMFTNGEIRRLLGRASTSEEVIEILSGRATRVLPEGSR